MATAKSMSRSRNQLGTSYAPESFFTFEGGVGGCISVSTAGEAIELSSSTKDLVFERITELGRSWFENAMQVRAGTPDKPSVIAEQCVDRALINRTTREFQMPGEDRFYLCKPSQMEYKPAPLTFVCRNCGLFRDFKNINEVDRFIEGFSLNGCPDPKAKGVCDWEQLDVIFVHWSGSWSQAFPGQFQWSEKDSKVVERRDHCGCVGGKEFRLNRKSSSIGEWFFECASCGSPLSQRWLQNDPKTLELIGSKMDESRRTEVRMQATPYRASSAYYVKTDLFIDFKDSSHGILDRLRPGREQQLKSFLSSNYGFAAKPVTDDDVRNACSDKPECASALAKFESAVATIKTTEDQLAGIKDDSTRNLIRGLLGQAYENKNSVIEDLQNRSILIPTVEMPLSITSSIYERQTLFAPKFDPFRLAAEHAALRLTRLDVETRSDGKKPYVSFSRMDEDLSPEIKEEAEQQEKVTKDLFSKLGIEDMGLIREFDLCRISFGYSRMESGPVLKDKRGMDMPVNFNLFPMVRTNDVMKHPIYVVQQGNEAIYVKLNEGAVLEWLKSLDCDDMFTLQPGEKIGAGILTAAHPMRTYLDKIHEGVNPPVYLYLYSLLHSYSHLLMKHISEYSGLDLGSLGEYIFPADLAFVVYRNGTTMDLGNLSAMWRNTGISMLTTMLSQKATQCGTGSLCTARGGACPDCLMVPETACVASNKLLSRSILRSVGGRPRFDKRKGSIKGYIDFCG